MGRDLHGVTAIAFDVYGTLVRIEDPRRPYRKLLALLHELGRTPTPDDGARLMSAHTGLAETAALLGMPLPARALVELEGDLAAELASVSLFEDALPTINALRAAGFRIGVCSNLAFPYAAPVVRLLPQLDAYAWSFSVGTVKPNPAIYASLCDALDASPAQVLMVGDTMAADYEGPRAYGMQACHLVREGTTVARLSISRLTQLPRLLGV